MSREPFQSESAELVRVEPAKGMARYYMAAIWPDLFGGVSLVREWGRLGQPGRLRLDAHPDTAGAQAKLVELVRRKERKGYRRIA